MTETTHHILCNFCGKSRSEVDKLIVANDAGICNECIDLCSTILNKEKINIIRSDKKISRALDPTKIKHFLDEYIVGQTDAKIALSVGIVNHFKRLHLKPSIEIEKSNILLYGPSGAGKTLLARAIAQYLGVPFVIADATTLTEAGYVGEDVESVIARLLAEAEYDVERCQQGIVFLDEIDKISRKSESASIVRDVSGEGVQQALLKLVEGTKCKININGTKLHPMMDCVEVDTRNILFIAAGAFDGLEKIVQQRQNHVGIGFDAIVIKKDFEKNSLLPEDFIKFGMIPEFAGRFPLFVGVDKLSIEDLKKILTEPKNCLIKQMQFYFESDDIELELAADAIDAISEMAYDLKIGARGLKTVLEKYLTPYLYKIPEIKSQGFKKITVSSDSIKYSKPPDFS